MNVLIVGLGSIAQKHIVALRQLYPDVKIYALRSAVGNAQEGILSIYSLNELDVKIDFAIISNPTNLHFQTISLLLPLGIPIMIEKPPVHALYNAEELVDKLHSNNTLTYVACNMRFHPCLQFLRQYIDVYKPVVNEVNVYCGSYLPDWRPGKNYREIYSANAEMGGGVHLDLFHEMDYTCWLFGFPKDTKSVQSSISSLNINAIDYANYILSYSSFNISIILNYYRKISKRTIEILFDDVTWIVDLIKCTIVSDSGEVIFDSPDFKIADTYLNQMAYFVDCINNGEKPMNTFHESLNVLKLSLQNG